MLCSRLSSEEDLHTSSLRSSSKPRKTCSAWSNCKQPIKQLQNAWTDAIEPSKPFTVMLCQRRRRTHQSSSLQKVKRKRERKRKQHRTPPPQLHRLLRPNLNLKSQRWQYRSWVSGLLNTKTKEITNSNKSNIQLLHQSSQVAWTSSLPMKLNAEQTQTAW